MSDIPIRRVGEHLELMLDGETWTRREEWRGPERIRADADEERELEYQVAAFLDEEVAHRKVLESTVAGIIREVGVQHGVGWGVSQLENGRTAGHVEEADVKRLSEAIADALLPKIATW